MIATGRGGHADLLRQIPLTPMPHDVDVKALTRLATLYDTPMALNRATADRLLPVITE